MRKFFVLTVTVAMVIAAALRLPGLALALIPPAPPPPPAKETASEDTLTISGELIHETGLASPHYTLDGWVLIFESPAALSRLIGSTITAFGTRYESPTILLRPHLLVLELETAVEGELVGVGNLGTFYYEVDGWVLAGVDTGSLKEMVGQRVQVMGTVLSSPSIYLKPMLAVRQVTAADPDSKRLSRPVKVIGQVPIFPEAPMVVEGHLLLPLRAVVEAAGGSLLWDGAHQTIVVTVGERSLGLAIGELSLSTGEELPIEPLLKNGHTFVPAQTFAALGLRLRWEDGGFLVECKVITPGAGRQFTERQPGRGLSIVILRPVPGKAPQQPPWR